MEIKQWGELSGTEVYEILKARSAVFMLEQDIRCLDMDDVDYSAVHIFECADDGGVRAYLRLFEDGEDGVRIGRVLTRQRGIGLGRELLDVACEYSRAHGYNLIRCDAQVRSLGFYESCGFRVVSDEFIEEGVPHVRVELRLDSLE